MYYVYCHYDFKRFIDIFRSKSYTRNVLFSQIPFSRNCSFFFFSKFSIHTALQIGRRRILVNGATVQHLLLGDWYWCREICLTHALVCPILYFSSKVLVFVGYFQNLRYHVTEQFPFNLNFKWRDEIGNDRIIGQSLLLSRVSCGLFQ